MIGLGIKLLKRCGCDDVEMLTGTLDERATFVCGAVGLLLVTPEIVSLFLTVSSEGALASRVSLCAVSSIVHHFCRSVGQPGCRWKCTKSSRARAPNALVTSAVAEERLQL